MPKPETPADPRLVLFVCTGNICRSPLAEALLRHRLQPDSPWQVASAGTCALEGDEASDGAIEALAEEGIEFSGHRSRRLTAELVRGARVIVALTRNHRDDILANFPEARQKVFLLKSFDPKADDGKDIPDPIGGSLAVYRNCRNSINAAMPGLAEFLEEMA